MMILWKERSSMHWQRFKSRSFYLLRYLFCQFLWPISHNPLQVCETSASDPFPLRSHHRMSLDESRFDWGTYGVSTSHQKKKLSSDEPCRWPLLYFFDGYQHDTWHSQRAWFVTCQKLVKFTDWFWGNEFLLSIHFLNSPALHMVQLDAPQSPYICVPIYLPKRHAGPPRVQFSRSLSSHGWHGTANQDFFGSSPIFSVYLT